MKNCKIILLLRLVPGLLALSFMDINAQDVTGSWSGTVTLHETVTYDLGNSDRQITIFFTDNKGTGTVAGNGEYIVGGKLFCKSSCSGSGDAELHEVTIDKEAGTYRIHVISPRSTCTNTGPFCSEPTTDNGFVDIIVTERPLDNNPNFLVGSETKVNDLAANGKVFTTITWNLVRTIDVELIVTPQNYDAWLPEPGIDEETQGSVINILLKVQGKNGRPLLQKAKAFELRLSNTSREPGITLNFPLRPGDPQPDLRFMMQPGADTSEAGQFISISCQSPCLTGSAKIAAFDGGGWTTLKAFAILEDDTQIKGNLLVPGGNQEIPIPKRDVGSKIATAWLDVNGNPNEMDDKDSSKGNSNKGDGLTAYEEYRGVISKAYFGNRNPNNFGRLDPNKKELGILLKQSETNLFKEGISQFKNACDIDAIVFDKNEIPDNRRLNQNAYSAHDFNQFVLRLSKGNTGERDIYGFEIEAFGITYPHVDIPARVTHIVIDVDRILADYQRDAQVVGTANLPYSEKDMLANTVAHEIGHGVHVEHHGNDIPYLQTLTVATIIDTIIYIYPDLSNWLSVRPYTINGPIGLPGNQQCGNVSCFMCYVNRSYWVRIRPDYFRGPGVVLYSVPILPYGNLFCTDKKGTGINAIKAGDYYYGDAINGNCLGQIRLRD